MMYHRLWTRAYNSTGTHLSPVVALKILLGFFDLLTGLMPQLIPKYLGYFLDVFRGKCVVIGLGRIRISQIDHMSSLESSNGAVSGKVSHLTAAEACIASCIMRKL